MSRSYQQTELRRIASARLRTLRKLRRGQQAVLCSEPIAYLAERWPGRFDVVRSERGISIIRKGG